MTESLSLSTKKTKLRILYESAFQNYKKTHARISDGLKLQQDFHTLWKETVDKSKTTKEQEEAAQKLINDLNIQKTENKAKNLLSFFKVSLFYKFSLHKIFTSNFRFIFIIFESLKDEVL